MINIQIKENMAHLEVDENGRSFKKLVTLEDFRKTIGINDTTYDSGFLPGRWGVKRILESSEEQKAIYVEPARRRQIKFRYNWLPDFDDNHTYTEEEYEAVGYGREERTDYEYEEYLRSHWGDLRRLLRNEFGTPSRIFDIMVPNAVLFVSRNLNNGRSTIRLYTTGFGSVITGEEDLYEYPMPNIYPTEGEICWGNVDMARNIENIRNIEGLLPSFLSSGFNHDLYEDRVTGELLEIWKGMDEAFKDGASEEEVLSYYDNEFLSISTTINYMWNK